MLFSGYMVLMLERRTCLNAKLVHGEMFEEHKGLTSIKRHSIPKLTLTKIE